MSLRRRLSRKLKRFFGSHDVVQLQGVPNVHMIVVATDSSEQEEALDRSLSRVQRQFGANARLINTTTHELPTTGLTVENLGTGSSFRTQKHPPNLSTVVMTCSLVHSHLLERARGESAVTCVVIADERMAPAIATCLQLLGQAKPEEREQHLIAKDYEGLCKTLSRQSDPIAANAAHLAFVERVIRDFPRLARNELSTHPHAYTQHGRNSDSGSGSGDVKTRPEVLSHKWKIKEVIMHGLPRLSRRLRPMLMMLKGDTVVYNSMTRAGGIRAVPRSAKFHAFPVNVDVTGDCLVRLYHKPEGRPGKAICTFAFSTGFFQGLADATTSWPTFRAQLRDMVCDDPSILPQNFFVDVVFDSVDSDPNDKPSNADATRARSSTTASPAPPLSASLRGSGSDIGSGTLAASDTAGRGSRSEGVRGSGRSGGWAINGEEASADDEDADDASTRPFTFHMGRTPAAPFDDDDDDEDTLDLIEHLRNALRLQSSSGLLPAHIQHQHQRDEEDVEEEQEEQDALLGDTDGGESTAPQPGAVEIELDDDPLHSTGVRGARRAEGEGVDRDTDGSRASSEPGAEEEEEEEGEGGSGDTAPEGMTDEEYARVLQAQFDEEDRRIRESMRRRQRPSRRRSSAVFDSSSSSSGGGGRDEGAGSRRLRRLVRERATERRRQRERPARRAQAAVRPPEFVAPMGSDDDEAQDPMTLQASLRALMGMFAELGMPPPWAHGDMAPVSRTQIRALPRHKLTGASSLLERECQICMCGYEEEEEVMTLPCLHIYHMACAERWLLQKPTCPICLTRIDAQPTHDADNE